MKNLTYMPFIRNRYFKGKLLTSEDFVEEQQYMNDKRRLVNRWMLGAGIAAGLEVIKVDDYSISLEMGLALDYAGREIVVDMPAIWKLSSLDGYQEAAGEEGSESLYVCIEYDEKQVEPVHNITNRQVHTVEEPEYNKIREGYHLYVTDDEPHEEEEQDGAWESGDERRAIYDRAEVIRRRSCEPGIHLAKIYLVKSGDFYMIDRVEPAPFGQYAYGAPLSGGFIKHMSRRLAEQEKKLKALGDTSGDKAGKKDKTARGGLEGDWQLSQGLVSIELPDGGREGRCYYSQEIAHGLGVGNVQINLEVIQGDYSFSGAEDIFDQEEKSVEAASRLSRSMGTFVIGVRALCSLRAPRVEVCWTALRRRSSNGIEEGEARIYIKPGLVNLKTHEDAGLKAVCVNLRDPALEWSVAVPEGGLVDEDGTYHAPGRPGVYEVRCRERKSGASASVFVIVRE